MVDKVLESYQRWITQTAREQECHDDEVAVVIYDYLRDTR